MITDKNMELARKARWNILRVLSDGKWHQTKDLKIETGVSSKTLYRHLKTLGRFIERREERVNGKFPVLAYYRANPTLLSVFTHSTLIDSAWKDIEEQFSKTTDFAIALKQINALSNVNMIVALANFKSRNVDIKDPDIVRLFLSSFVWQSYEILTSRLIEASLKIIDDVDVGKTTGNLVKV